MTTLGHVLARDGLLRAWRPLGTAQQLLKAGGRSLKFLAFGLSRRGAAQACDGLALPLRLRCQLAIEGQPNEQYAVILRAWS